MKGTLVITTTTSIVLGSSLYNVNSQLHNKSSQLGKARIQIKHQQSNYKKLKKDFFKVESENQKLSKKQKELQSQLNKLKDKNNDLQYENRQLNNKVDQLKKAKVDVSNNNTMHATNNNTSHVSNNNIMHATNIANHNTSTNSNKYSGWKKINVIATGYSLIGDTQGSDGDPQTATGSLPHWGTIAVDPSVIPLGSTVFIPEFNMEFKAEDTGGAINGNHIDIYFSNGNRAREWGVKNITIIVKSN